ncbi:MAG: hypothetical protein ACT4RN_21165 [Pseudonocardia sp.]
MTQVLPHRCVAGEIGLLLAAWCPAAAAGWGLHALVSDPAATGAVRAAGWLSAAVVAIALGALLARLLPATAGPARWASVAAVGWGIATSAGWFLAVEVGGPTTGIVTGVVLAAAPVVRPDAGGVGRTCGVIAAGLAGVLVGWVLTGGAAAGAPGLLLPTAGGVVGLLAGRAVLLPALPAGRLTVLVVVSGSAWVGAWALAVAHLSPVSLGLSIVGEIVLAMTVGGVAIGLLWAGATGEPAVRVAARWAVAAVGGLIVGLAVAAVLRTGTGGEVVEQLDAGTTVGLGLAAWVASLPTLRRLTDPARVAPG